MSTQRIYPVIMITLLCSGTVFAEEENFSEDREIPQFITNEELDEIRHAANRANGKNPERVEEELVQGLRQPAQSSEGSLPAELAPKTSQDDEKQPEDLSQAANPIPSDVKQDVLAALAAEKKDPHYKGDTSKKDVAISRALSPDLQKLQQRYPYEGLVSSLSAADRDKQKKDACDVIRTLEAHTVASLALAGNVNEALSILGKHREEDFNKIKELAVKNIELYAMQIARQNNDELARLYSHTHDMRDAIKKAAYNGTEESLLARTVKHKDVALTALLTGVGLTSAVAYKLLK